MELISNCCYAPPVDDETFIGGESLLGRCSQCKEGAVFKEEGEDND